MVSNTFRKFVLKDLELSDDQSSLVIAEIGHNHQGCLETCKKMFMAAKNCGAQAVKLQKRSNKFLFTKELYYSKYDNPNSYGDTYGEHREALEFDYDQFVELKKYAEELGLSFLCTAFDFPSVDFLEDIGIDGYKIASGDLKNTPLIEYIAKTEKPIIVSTGGGTIDDVQRAYDTIKKYHNNFSILQCTASYPSEPEDMNLRVIETYRNTFPDIVIGLSDHQNGISMALIAYMLGARIFEKHFTLNRGWKGTDQAFSLEPIGLSKLVRDLSRTQSSLGDGIKRPLSCEIKPLIKMSKVIVAACDLDIGQILTVHDVALKSPGSCGLPPYELDNVIGKKIIRSIHEDEAIMPEDLDN